MEEKKTLENENVVVRKKVTTKKAQMKILLLMTLQCVSPFVFGASLISGAAWMTAKKTGVAFEVIEEIAVDTNMLLMMAIAIMVGMVAYHFQHWCAETYNLKIVGVLMIGGLLLATWGAIGNSAASAYGIYNVLLMAFCAIEGFTHRWLMLFTRREIQRTLRSGLIQRSDKNVDARNIEE